MSDEEDDRSDYEVEDDYDDDGDGDAGAEGYSDNDNDDDSAREAPAKSSSKSKRDSSHLDPPQKKKKKSKKSKRQFRFFDDEAEDAEEDEDEEEYDERAAADEEVLDEDEIEARRRVELRHQQNRDTLAMDAKDIAARYEERARQQSRMRQMNVYGDGGLGMAGGRTSTVLQQSLLPSVTDPSLFRVKAAPGKEDLLVMAIMRKALDSFNKGGPMRIKSCFSSSSKGYIYIEAIAEPLAREAIMGLRGVYNSSLAKVPVQEMTAVLNVTVAKKPLYEGQWVRIKRGPLKGDLGRIHKIIDGGSRVWLQAVPRPDYTGSLTGKGSDNRTQVRPAQKLFDPREVVNSGGESARKFMPGINNVHKVDFWDNDYYKDGFIMKEVNPETYIAATNVNPRMEEQKMFLVKPQDRERMGDNDSVMDDESVVDRQTSLVKELAQQLEDLHDDTKKAMPFSVGDLVQITGGELRNLIAKIVSINDRTSTATVRPTNSSTLTGEFVVELGLLVKYVMPGVHVKVANGPYAGQTGRVVSVNAIDGKPVAVILTDGINTEIQCEVNYVQVSSEVTSGLGNLMGYELYDLVVLNENESAVVIAVGAEKLRLINHMDIVKDAFPMELQGKRNTQSIRSTAFDANQNSIKVGDIVNCTSGVHDKRSGTIKHIMKGSIWLHSNSYLKNSGVFVIRARCCVVTGANKSSGGASISAYLGPLAASTISGVAVGSKVSASARPNARAAKDEAVGKTVRITRGQYKGLLAQIIDCTGEHYSVELLAKMKKITIEKSKTVLVGDKTGSLQDSTSNNYRGGYSMDAISSTPFLTQETPSNFVGAETPRYAGGETPNPYGTPSAYGTPSGRTPGHYSSDDVWRVTSKDVNSATNYSAYDRGAATSNTYSSMGADAYSPMDASSPYSVTSNATGTSSIRTSAPVEWYKDMIVCFRQGSYSGKTAVVRSVPASAGGDLIVTMRSESGTVYGKDFPVQPQEIMPLEPKLRSKVKIVSGARKGLSGFIDGFEGNNDVFVEITETKEVDLFRLKNVVCIM